MSVQKVIWLLVIGLLLSTFQTWRTSPVVAAEGGPGENADVEIGGPGDGPGQFVELLDIAFGPDNRLYALEGRRRDNQSKTWAGGCRVQVFDNGGKYVEQFPVEADGLSDEKTPARLAVGDDGRVFVSEPVTGVVLEYRRGDRWGLSKQYTIPDAFAIAPWNVRGKQHIAVLAKRYEHNQQVPFDRIELIDFQGGKLAEPLVLSRPLTDVMDVTPDGRGNLYVVAAVNQLYRYDAAGKLTAALGSGAWRRLGDGSELRHAVAVDSQGRIYSQAWGRIARFEPDLKSVALENGQFYWYDNWSPHDGYTPMAIDKEDRLWIGATGNVPLDVRHHYRPCVSRVREDFFEKAKPQSTLALGFDPTITTGLPYNVAYDLSPIELELVVPKAFRQIRDVVVDYRVYDVYKSKAARGSFSLKLEDDVEARQTFRFTPPRFGWYTVECHVTTNRQPVLSVGAHLAVTPKVEGLPQLADGDSPGGWIDPVKQAFCGLRLMRLHTTQGEETIEKTLAAAEKLGLTVVVQFQDKKDCQGEMVRRFVSKFKGRVKYWEIVNEPNFSMSPQEYAKLAAEVTPLIKGIDPAAHVMGPAVCGINLDWHRQVFKTGAGKHFGIISIHDYEGNEAVDPGHWRWKIAQLRELMSQHGVGNKPIWQTERAIGGVRADNFLGGVQAVRVTLQRDVMETLGVPNQHNLHYYLNQAGYGTVPTYVWSESGPHPVALALRTREAMVRGRRYAGTLDFGRNGNRIFLGLRYQGGDGSTVVLRQYGAAAEPSIELGIRGGATLEVVDSFGNRRKIPVRDGKVTLKVALLPIYLRLERGQEIAAPRIDFGRNLATDATITYSGKTESDPSVLTNGVFEVTHAGSLWGPYWVGDLSRAPQTLDITFSQPRPVDRLIVYSMRADNPHCYLVDFDVQYHDGRQWVTRSEVRTPLPPSDVVRTAQSKANTWYLDQNFAVVEFPAVTTDRLRVVARRSTLGFQPDETAAKATGWQAGGPNLHLREIEVYGPPVAVEVAAELQQPVKTAAFERETVTLTAANRTDKARDVIARLAVPDGWTTEPPEAPLTVSPGSRRSVAFALVPPDDIPTGQIPLEAALVDKENRTLDYRRFHLEVTAPVAVTPQMPEAINQQNQPMPVGVENLTDRPLAGKVRVSFAPEGLIDPVEKAFAAIGPGQSATVEVSVPGLKLTEAAWQVDYAVTTEHLVTTARQNFAEIRLWQVLGPFPNADGAGFETVYPPEKGIDLSQPVTLPDGRTRVAWKLAANNPAGFVDLLKTFQPNNQVCAYAAIYVRSPTARKALLSAGSDDGIKAWINGQLAVSHNLTRGAAPGQEEASVTLRAGWNEVLLKITQGDGGWGFYFDLLAPDGQPIPGLVYGPKPGS